MNSYNYNAQNFSYNSQVSVSLLSSDSNFNILKHFTPNFTIITKNRSNKFNTLVLMYFSNTISIYLRCNTNSLSYNLDIEDDRNVLGKFEKLYQGEFVTFDREDLQTAYIIIEKLNITSIPNFLRRTSNKSFRYVWSAGKQSVCTFIINGSTFKIDQTNQILIRSILNNSPNSIFTIQTNKYEYKCNFYAVLSSSVIKKFIEENPQLYYFKYDFDDDEGQFHLISSILNFSSIQLTSNNVDTINEIAQDLGIDCILTIINKYISETENVSKTIDDQEEIVNSIDDLFYSLYHIKEKTVDSVVNMIENSKWSQTIENVYEFSAFVFQVIQTKIDLHQFMIDLLIKLNKVAIVSNNNILKELLPFVVNHSLILFSENLAKINTCELIFPFVYKMYKAGLIPKERIEKKLRICQITNSYFVSWFMPELTQFNSKIKNTNLIENDLILKLDDSRIRMYYPCNSCNIENKEFERIRDEGECGFELEKALRNDDVDTFQSIVSKSKNNELLKEMIRQQNIFEPFIKERTSYLNYAAAYGSIKCFKYMLLNDVKIDDSTFEMAILGGNNELIRIVDNETIDNLNRIELNKYKHKSALNALKIAIQNHRNDLFDWILEQKFSFINRSDDLLSLFTHSLNNGNIHSLIQIIDKDFNINGSSHNYSQFLGITAKNGFYSLTIFLINLIQKSKNNLPLINIENAVYFDNIYMFKVFEDLFKEESLENTFIFASRMGLMYIVRYFFDNYVNKNFQLNSNNSFSLLYNCIHYDSKENIDYIFDKIMNLYPVSIKSLLDLLDKAFNAANFDAIEKVAEIVYKNDPNYNFTELFSKAAKMNLIEVVKFFIDKKYQIYYDDLDTELPSYELEIFLLILDNVEHELKERFLNCLSKAIQNKNRPLVKYLLSQNVNMDNALILATEFNDFKMVQMVLDKNSEPSFINQNSPKGTALIIATRFMNHKIFNLLLSTPGIDPSIYDQNYLTPLVLLAQQLNVEQFDSIIKFYGEDIKKQKWQLEKALKCIIEQNSHETVTTSQILLQIINLNCINVNYRTQKNSLLSFACKINAFDVVKTLIQKDEIDVNLSSTKIGDTPLIISIKTNNNNITNLLIEHPKIDIDKMNFEGKSPLQLAVDFHQVSIIKSILNHSKFNADRSQLNLIFYKANPQMSKLLITHKSLDVCYVPNDEDRIIVKNGGKNIIQTSLIKSIVCNDKMLFDLIIKHPSFKKDQSQIIDAICVAFIENKTVFFNSILEIFDSIDVNSNVIFGQTPLIAATKENINEQMISFIITHKSFDSKKSDIVQAFLQLHLLNLKHTNSVCLNIMNTLFNYDIAHDHLIDTKLKEDGCKVLSEIYFSKYVQNTFGKNQLSSNDFYLRQLIESDQNLLALCLINSNTINLNECNNRYNFGFNKKLEQNSYLHIACEFGRIRIIEEILNRHLLDINITNSLGETPLIVACKCQQIECVEFLFKFDDLDFSHVDKKGNDALAIVKSFSKNKNYGNKSDAIKNKDEYLSELLKSLNSSKNKLKFMHSNQPATQNNLSSLHRSQSQNRQNVWGSNAKSTRAWGSGWGKS